MDECGAAGVVLMSGAWSEPRAWLHSAAALVRSGAVTPGSVAEVRADGHALAAEVRRELARIGVAPASIERRGPRIVVVTLPPAWPMGWDVAPLLRVHGATALQVGATLTVRR